MLKKQEKELKRQREAFERKQQVARENDFRTKLKLEAKERERQLKRELNSKAKKKASGVFSKMLLEHLEDLIDSENLEGTIESLLENNFDLTEPEVAQMTNVLVEKTEELKTEVHPFGERSEEGEVKVEAVDAISPLEDSEEDDDTEVSDLDESEDEDEDETASGSEASDLEGEVGASGETEEVEEEVEDADNFV